MPEGNDLGTALKGLRLSRGLGLSETARRAGTSKAALSKWEGGTHLPRGPAFGRLLDVLEADPRTRARLLAAADPAYARIALADAPLGAPVHVGLVLRAIRGRANVTQADLARAVGVTQATVARWESGEAAPAGGSLHAACFALDAAPEELLALAHAADEGPLDLPDDPEAAAVTMAGTVGHTHDRSLYEAVSLGLEAEAWRRAARDPRWDVALARVLGDRANMFFCLGRLGEVEEPARRAVRLARTPEARLQATPAVGALVALARHREEPPQAIGRAVEGWTGRLPTSQMLAWMMWERALCLARTGAAEEAIDLTERSNEMHDLACPDVSEGSLTHERAYHRSETLLSAGQPERALEAWPSNARTPCNVVYLRAKLACGEPATEGEMAGLRAAAAGAYRDVWIFHERAARIEREQARLTDAAR